MKKILINNLPIYMPENLEWASDLRKILNEYIKRNYKKDLYKQFDIDPTKVYRRVHATVFLTERKLNIGVTLDNPNNKQVSKEEKFHKRLFKVSYTGDDINNLSMLEIVEDFLNKFADEYNLRRIFINEDLGE